MFAARSTAPLQIPWWAVRLRAQAQARRAGAEPAAAGAPPSAALVWWCPSLCASLRGALRAGVRRRGRRGRESGACAAAEGAGASGDGSTRERREEEQAPSPARRRRATQMVLVSYLASSLSERSFLFGLPVVLATAPDSFSAIAFVAFVTSLFTFVCGPAAGHVLDRLPRFYGLVSCLLVQAAAIVVALVATYNLFASPTVQPLKHAPLYPLLLAASCVERLAAIVSDVAYERDWLVQLAGREDQAALAEVNATVRRLDLACEIIGPLVFGVVLASFGPLSAMGMCALGAALILPMQIALLVGARAFAGPLLTRKKRKKRRRAASSKAALKEEEEAGGRVRRALVRTAGKPVAALTKGWKIYLAQPVLAASLAYVMLHFNTCLSPSSLLSAYLSESGVSVAANALFRGSSAAMGFIATILFPVFVARRGVLATGSAALVFMAGMVTLAGVTYGLFLEGAASGGATVPLGVFLACVMCSRFGLWLYEMANLQIHQTAISERQMGSVSMTEMSLCSLSELVMFACASALESSFALMVLVSSLSVVAACGIFVRWERSVDRGELRVRAAS